MVAAAAGASARSGEDWSRFRGPNGSGVSTSGSVPLTFGPTANVIWKTPLPFGHSSPILTSDRIYLTAVRDERLVTIALERRERQVLWEREAPRSRTEKLDSRNGPAAPARLSMAKTSTSSSPTTDWSPTTGNGKERWRVPLGPFNNIYGMGASPVLVDDLVVLVCDQSTGSYIVALDKRSGAVRWKTARTEAHSGHSTPSSTSRRAAARRSSSGVVPADCIRREEWRKAWWVRGLSFELKSTPVVSGDTLFINGFGSPENQPGSQRTIPAYEEAIR